MNWRLERSYAAWIEALQIIAKYDKGFHIAAEHDIIYAGDKKDDMSMSDVQRLEELGWHYDEGLECFYHNV